VKVVGIEKEGTSSHLGNFAFLFNTTRVLFTASFSPTRALGYPI